MSNMSIKEKKKRI
jgi:hypothetical protein